MLDYTLTIGGTDVSKVLPLNDVKHTMFCENHADTVNFTFNDAQGFWSRNAPDLGTEIRFKYGKCDTGIMYVSDITPTPGLCDVFAMAVSPSSFVKKYRSWENATFDTLANQIAKEHNLLYSSYSCGPITYQYIRQDGIDDFRFLNNLCMLESRSLLVFDGKLIAYDQKAMEKRDDAKQIAVGKDGSYSYREDTCCCCGKCVVYSGASIGVYTDAAYDPNKILYPEGLRAVNDTQAARYAQGALRAINKDAECGTIETRLITDVCAASIIEIVNTDDTSRNGNMFVTKVRQSYLRDETKIWFRKPLEW